MVRGRGTEDLHERRVEIEGAGLKSGAVGGAIGLVGGEPWAFEQPLSLEGEREGVGWICCGALC